jgi:uncharacterized protein YjiS (DUF1127 family)
MRKWLNALWAAIEEGQQRRADYWILQNLSERELRDLGISRGEIRGIVYDKKSYRETKEVS